MRLFNSLTRSVENFRPDGAVKYYACGITPYDTTHLGHAFTYVISDILIRFLESRGHDVVYVQNVTDIDDDILKKAREVGQDWQSLGNCWTRHFIEDMKKLNVRPPEHYPRATEAILEIIDITGRLLSKGIAYEESGNVYFSVESWSSYGKLSRLSEDKMLPIANQRGNHPDDPHKRSPLDFPLWIAQREDEPSWHSPWGEGRPGWHIECSTMATKLLGESIDIHSGGEDLLFPHHECEIAQVEPLTGDKPFVRFWMHVAMVHHNGEKMSKSLGNLVMIDDLLKTWSADAVRIYLGRHHYRQTWSHKITDLERAADLGARLKKAVTAKSGDKDGLAPDAFRRSFTQALENDLDTPTAFDTIETLANEILSASQANQNVAAAQDTLRAWGDILGLRFEAGSPDPGVIEGWNAHQTKFKG